MTSMTLSTLAAAFSRAVLSFDNVRIAHDFDGDFETAMVNTEMIRLKLSRWGAAINLISIDLNGIIGIGSLATDQIDNGPNNAFNRSRDATWILEWLTRVIKGKLKDRIHVGEQVHSRSDLQGKNRKAVERLAHLSLMRTPRLLTSTVDEFSKPVRVIRTLHDWNEFAGALDVGVERLYRYIRPTPQSRHIESERELRILWTLDWVW